LLNLVRTRQPISRADLARLSGLQRSTVSLIVEELLADRWVIEGSTGRLPRGRRPTYLRLNNDRKILGIDIRPTTTRIGVADLNARFLSLETMRTADQPKVFLDALIERIRRMLASYPQASWEGIGVSLPGRVDRRTHRLVLAPNLAWKDVDLKTPLEQATGLRVEMENAANACVLSEIWFGDESKSASDLIVVTVSEGIGTGILANGQLVVGNGGFAGEFGHAVLDPAGPACPCGNRGCWEVFASNSAALRYYSGDRSHRDINLSFAELLTLANQDDVRAKNALDEMARHLGAGLSMLVAGLAPSRIILIGEVTRAWLRVGPIVEQVLSDRVSTKTPPRIEPTEDATQPRLFGTLALVLQKHFGTPLILQPALWSVNGGAPEQYIEAGLMGSKAGTNGGRAIVTSTKSGIR
jgi:predicted NBD/HSP70 family sugar kinase